MTPEDSARSVFSFLDSFEIEPSLSLVFLKLVTSRKDFGWVEHLGGAIMRLWDLFLFMPAESTAPPKCLPKGFFSYTF
jgi:hypothetical protein